MKVLETYIKAIQYAATQAYKSEVIETKMSDLIDQTKEDWIDDKIQEWLEGGAGVSSECNTLLCESASSQQTVQNADSRGVLETEFRSIISHRMLGYDCDMEVEDWEGMLDDLVDYAYKHFDT